MARTLARGRLGTFRVAGSLLAGVALLMVVAALIPTGFAVTGITSIPVMMFIVVALLSLFFVGFLTMAPHVENAGAFYSYIARGLGRAPGVGAAFISVTAYSMLVWALDGLFGATVAPMLAARPGWHQPWWVWSLLMVVAVGFTMTRNVARVTVLLGVLTIAEVVLVLILTVSGFAHPAPGAGILSGFSLHHLTGAGITLSLAIGVLCLIGSEIGAVFREEARDGTRTIFRATLVAIISMAVLYIAAPAAMITHYGPDGVVTAAQTNGTETLFDLTGPGPLHGIGHVLLVTSMISAVLAFGLATNRYLYVLGADGVLPAALGNTNKSGAFRNAALVQTIGSAAVVGLYAVMGWDPIVQLFFWLGQTGGYLILVLFATASLSVVMFFIRRGLGGTSVWKARIAPALSTLAFGVLVGFVWHYYSTLLGETTPSPASRLLPVLWVPIGGVGMLWAIWRAPDIHPLTTTAPPVAQEAHL